MMSEMKISLCKENSSVYMFLFMLLRTNKSHKNNSFYNAVFWIDYIKCWIKIFNISTVKSRINQNCTFCSFNLDKLGRIDSVTFGSCGITSLSFFWNFVFVLFQTAKSICQTKEGPFLKALLNFLCTCDVCGFYHQTTGKKKAGWRHVGLTVLVKLHINYAWKAQQNQASSD
jgi:hypothetical protein